MVKTKYTGGVALVLTTLLGQPLLAQPSLPFPSGSLPGSTPDPEAQGIDPAPGPSPATAASPLPLTLPELLNLTLAGNRDLQNRRLDRLVERQQLAEAEQRFDPRFTPTLGVSSSLREDRGEANPGDGLFNQGGTEADLEGQIRLDLDWATRLGSRLTVGVDPLASQPLEFRLSQPLARGFGSAINEAPLNQARLEEGRNQLALRRTLIDTLTTSIASYTNLISAQTQVEIQSQALARRQRQLEILQALVAAGRRAPIDLFDTERSLADAQRRLVDAQNQLLQANNALLNLIGTDRALVFVVDPGDIDQLFLLAQERAARYQTTDLVPIALAQRPDYQQSQLQRQQLDLERQLAVDQQRWQVDAIVDSNLGDGSRTELGLVARRTLNDPQLETRQVTSQVRLQQQDNTLTQQQDQIRNDVTTRMGDVAANQRAVAAAERATQNARRQLQANQEQYRLGRGNVTLFQIIAQEEDLVSAQTNELESRIAFLNSVAQLEQTVGITLEVWADQLDLSLLREDFEGRYNTTRLSVWLGPENTVNW